MAAVRALLTFDDADLKRLVDFDYRPSVSLAIAKAGGIPPLVELLRDGSAEAKLSVVRPRGRWATSRNNAAAVLIAEAGGIPPLVALFRDGDVQIEEEVQIVLENLAYDNDANAVAIAVAVGFYAVVELARRGRVAVDGALVLSYYTHGRVPAKAALVVAALIGDCVPVDSVPRVIKDIIITYL
ncbi:hypothetical protein JL720_11952 [Aureococcus anophagefferens]|nr:hypothetical protein JL720_11952 [Aureococcus anophagefferens]